VDEPLDIVVGRIERLARDAIVNASNRELMAGAGVDHAIRSAAGPEMSALLARHGPMGMRPAVMTPGFALPAKFVIHTAAPVWFIPGDRDEKIAGLALCYSACLEIAAQAGLRTLAFPALGTGIFGWPKDLACRIALATVRGTRAEGLSVTFCCFTEEDAEIYRAEMAR
jgi:O-acetyl-ADP-ribose deacetylase (regulator of RNase III)